MSDQMRTAAGAALGALAGALAVYVVFTPQGREMMARLGPALDDLSAALQEFRVAIHKAGGVAQDAKGAYADVRAVFAGDRGDA